MTGLMKRTIVLVSILLMATTVRSAYAGSTKVPSEAEISANPGLLLDCAEAAAAKVRDSRSVLVKKEILKGKSVPEETISVIFKAPSKILLKWLDGESKGMQALYDGVKDPGTFEALDVGWKGAAGISRWALSSKFTKVFHPNRYTIADTGLKALVAESRHNLARVEKAGGTQTSAFGGRKKAPVIGTETFHIHTEFSIQPAPDLPMKSSDTYYDTRSCMLVAVTMNGKNGETIGRYVHKNIVINAGIPDSEFAITKK